MSIKKYSTMMKKVLTVIGARPQFIKCGPVSRVLRKNFKEILVHTGQHYDEEMSKVFFKQLNIPKPDYNLNVGSASHAVQTASIMIGLEKIILKNRPNLIIIYGDTNSTLAGALVGAKLQIPIAHIEAGLRSFNKKMPEELNRITADHYSDFLFCPSETSVSNLKSEGIKKNVFMVGDVMKDAVLNNINLVNPVEICKRFNLDFDETFYFLTIHRQENTDDPKRFKKIIRILELIKYQVVFPIHPRTRKIIKQNKFVLPSNVSIINPINYLESICLQKLAKIIITDSGGIQKEAYFLHTPCITLRDETEWVETVKDGKNRVVGTDINKFRRAEEKFLQTKLNFNSNAFYGDGKASKKIADILRKNL